MTATVQVAVESSLPPDRVLAAAYDFSARRPEIWANIHPRFFEVHGVKQSSAEVTEGGLLGPLVAWERCDYDWSAPGRVKATVTDSNVYIAHVSSWEMQVTPTANGSRVEMTWVRGFKRTPTAKFLALGYRLGGRRLFTPDVKKFLTNLQGSSNG